MCECVTVKYAPAVTSTKHWALCQAFEKTPLGDWHLLFVVVVVDVVDIIELIYIIFHVYLCSLIVPLNIWLSLGHLTHLSTPRIFHMMIFWLHHNQIFLRQNDCNERFMFYHIFSLYRILSILCHRRTCVLIVFYVICHCHVWNYDV